nr:5-oxoprolinase-like protein [Tanacetum cinerariifolium]
VSGNNDASNSREKPVGVSVSNKANEESNNEALMFISEDDCIDLDEVYKKLGGRWGCSVFTDMVNDGPLSHGKVCVLIESLHRVLESLKVSYRNRSYCITATEFAYWASNIESTEDKSMIDSLERKDDEGPSLDGGSEHEEPLDVDNCDSVSSKDDNNDLDSSSEMSSTSRLMREVDVPGVDSDHVDSFEECEIIGDSVLNNDGCVKDYMEKNLDDDVEKDIEDCSKNVIEKCGVV